MQICLSTSDSITLELAGAVSADQPEFIASYIDTTSDAPGSTKGETNDTTPVTAVAAPAADQRLVYRIDICNVDSAEVTVILKVAGGTGRTVIKHALAAGASVNLLDLPAASSGSGVSVADLGGGALTVGGSAGNGTAATASRSDHVHAITNPKLDDLAAPDDNTDLNATASAHGLLPKLGGGTTNFLRADGTWAEPPGTGAAADLADLRDQIMYLMFREDNDQVQLSGLVFDSFDDEGGIDAANSLNESYDSANDLYTPTGGTIGETDQCSGGTPLSGGDYDVYVKANAFDDNNSTAWLSSQSSGHSGVAYIGYDLGSAKTIGRIQLRNGWTGNGTGYGLTSVKIQHSDDGSNWTDNATVVLTDDAGASFQNCDVTSPASHRYWRLLANSSDATGSWAVMEVQMFEGSNSYDNLTLISEAVTASATPDKARISAFIEPIDSVTINTDLTAHVSSDDGSTWDAVTLSKAADIAAIDQFVGEVDLTGAGTSMVWKLTTANNKNLKVTAVGLAWWEV